MVRIMRSALFMEPRSIAFATLLSVMASPATAGAREEDGPPGQLAGIRLVYGVDDAPTLSHEAAPKDVIRRDIDDPSDHDRSSPVAGERPALRAGPHDRPFIAVLAAFPLVTYAAATGPRPSETLTLADRFATSQLIGGGYVMNPQFRFGVIGIFNEALTGLPPAADAWQFGGFVPIAIGTFIHLIIGGGPIIGYRSGGKNQSDVGALILTGASIPLRRGLALNIAAPTTALSMRRVTVSVGVAVGVAKVF
jgi:hypothetical protein